MGRMVAARGTLPGSGPVEVTSTFFWNQFFSFIPVSLPPDVSSPTDYFEGDCFSTWAFAGLGWEADESSISGLSTWEHPGEAPREVLINKALAPRYSLGLGGSDTRSPLPCPQLV